MVKNLLRMALKMQILKLNHGVMKNYHSMNLLQKLRDQMKLKNNITLKQFQVICFFNNCVSVIAFETVII